MKADELKATLTVKQGFNREGSWYVEFVSENDAVFYNVSDNGKWAVGSYNGNTLIYNIETGEAVYNTVDGEGGQANNLGCLRYLGRRDTGRFLSTLPAVLSRRRIGRSTSTDGHSMGAIYESRPTEPSAPASWKRQRFQTGQVGQRADQYLTCPATSFTERKPMPDFVVKSMSADGFCVGAD